MPRPPNPGWAPKTMMLSAPVIAAVWARAAREGKSPGRLVDALLSQALFGAAPMPGSAPPSQPDPPAAPPHNGPLLDRIDRCVRLRFHLDRAAFFRALGALAGEAVPCETYHRWRRGERVAAALSPHLDALLAGVNTT
jgi:hypothetical protein